MGRPGKAEKEFCKAVRKAKPLRTWGQSRLWVLRALGKWLSLGWGSGVAEALMPGRPRRGRGGGHGAIKSVSVDNQDDHEICHPN